MSPLAIVLMVWLAGALVAASAHWNAWATLFWPLAILTRFMDGD